MTKVRVKPKAKVLKLPERVKPVKIKFNLPVLRACRWCRARFLAKANSKVPKSCPQCGKKNWLLPTRKKR